MEERLVALLVELLFLWLYVLLLELLVEDVDMLGQQHIQLQLQLPQLLHSLGLNKWEVSHGVCLLQQKTRTITAARDFVNQFCSV